MVARVGPNILIRANLRDQDQIGKSLRATMDLSKWAQTNRVTSSQVLHRKSLLRKSNNTLVSKLTTVAQDQIKCTQVKSSN